MSWFNKHLNWALLIFTIILTMVSAILWAFTSFTVFLIIGIVAVIIVQIWYLGKKNRSGHWLFLNLLGGGGTILTGIISVDLISVGSSIFIGGLFMLMLKNKRIDGTVGVQDDIKCICDECGGEINEVDKFCPRCGVEFEEGVSE